MSTHPSSAIVYGGGLAALMAAAELAGAGVDVQLVGPTSMASWPTCADGGLACPDDAESLVLDTLGCGDLMAARPPVRAMARAARGLVDDLTAIGVPFATEGDGWALRRLPGMKQAGAVFTPGGTELAIASSLERSLMARDTVPTWWQPFELLSLIVASGRCVGIVAKHTLSHAIRAFTANFVILAGGGPERMLGARTGSLCLEAPIALAAQHGAVLANPSWCQQHPAALATARGLVVPTAAVRAEGGRIWVPQNAGDARPPHAIPRKERSRFLEDAFPDWAELAPDHLAAGAARDIAQKRSRPEDEAHPPHYLDLSHLPEGHLAARLGSELEALRITSGVDPTRTAVEVVAAPLGLLGGLWIDHEPSPDGMLAADSPRQHATSIPGLYAAGPWASLYHGRCQLGGNQALADLFGGALAAQSGLAFALREGAPKRVDKATHEAVSQAEAAHATRAESGFGASHRELETNLRVALRDLVGAQEYELADTAKEIDELAAQLEAMPPEARAGDAGADRLHALEQMLTLAQLIAASALAGDEPHLVRRRSANSIEVAAELSVDGTTISAAVAPEGIDVPPHRYRGEA